MLDVVIVNSSTTLAVMPSIVTIVPSDIVIVAPKSPGSAQPAPPSNTPSKFKFISQPVPPAGTTVVSAGVAGLTVYTPGVSRVMPVTEPSVMSMLSTRR